MSATKAYADTFGSLVELAKRSHDAHLLQQLRSERGGHRSAGNYFSRAREEHLMLTGLPVPESVNQAI